MNTKHTPDKEDFYTLQPGDIGAPAIHAFGRPWVVSSFIGAVLPVDIGKRVFHRNGILQVENEDQRSRRIAGNAKARGEV